MSIRAHVEELACEELAIFKNQDRHVATNAATRFVETDFVTFLRLTEGPLTQ